MPLVEWIFDGLLGVLVVVLALTLLYARVLTVSVVLFIAFGLLLAVVWARLGAPDLALAEAAIGAGLTGALLLAAVAQSGAVARAETANPPLRVGRLWPIWLLALLVLLLLLRAVVALAANESSALGEQVMTQLDASGVGHPVTAVLLNFRAWDTLLELVVLLLALLGVRQLRPKTLRIAAPWPLLQAWSRALAPLAVLVGGYLLWRGSNYPGGAFQAGAMLAAAAVVLRLNHWLPPVRWSQWWVRSSVVAGAWVFVIVASLTYWLGVGWLAYPTAYSGLLILTIEIVATWSIAVTLALLVVGEPEELQA